MLTLIWSNTLICGWVHRLIKRVLLPINKIIVDRLLLEMSRVVRRVTIMTSEKVLAGPSVNGKEVYLAGFCRSKKQQWLKGRRCSRKWDDSFGRCQLVGEVLQRRHNDESIGLSVDRTPIGPTPDWHGKPAHWSSIEFVRCLLWLPFMAQGEEKDD